METYSFIMESMPDTIDIAVVGNIITIENEDYIVIDDRMVIKSKSGGEMKFDTVEIPESKYINYERPTNIGYYLDKTYYANLSQNLKESIEETNYNVAYNYNNAPQYKQYKVALITRELLFKHGNSVTNALKAHLQSIVLVDTNTGVDLPTQMINVQHIISKVVHLLLVHLHLAKKDHSIQYLNLNLEQGLQ